jgi:hypothetical protein
MIRIDLNNKPAWLDLGHGVRLHLHPLTTAMMVASRNDPAVAALDDNETDEVSALIFAKALARNAVLDWEGVGNAEGNIISVSPEGIDALLDVWPLFEAFQTKYVTKGLVLDAEKNVSAPLPSGSSAGVTDTAKPAPDPAKTVRKP